MIILKYDCFIINANMVSAIFKYEVIKNENYRHKNNLDKSTWRICKPKKNKTPIFIGFKMPWS